jgi:sulfate transport system permease protein
MGEFGAVSIVSGHITGRTDTMPLRVEKLYQDYNAPAAFAVASLLAVLALITLILKSYFEWRSTRDEAKAQQSFDTTTDPPSERSPFHSSQSSISPQSVP